MKSNFDQFDAMGNPWVTEKTWDHEVRDACNPRCSTGRRKSAIAFLEKSHIMRFPAPVEPKPEPARSEVSETSMILSIRNRLAAPHVDEPASLQSWQTRVHTPSKSEPEAVSDADSDSRKRDAARKQYFRQFKTASDRTKAPLFFNNYSEIVRLFGSLEIV